MQPRRKKYRGAGTRDGLSHWILKRKGGRDLATRGRDLAGPKILHGSYCPQNTVAAAAASAAWRQPGSLMDYHAAFI